MCVTIFILVKATNAVNCHDALPRFTVVSGFPDISVRAGCVDGAFSGWAEGKVLNSHAEVIAIVYTSRHVG